MDLGDDAPLQLEGGVGGIVRRCLVGGVGLVPALRDMDGAETADAFHRAEQVVEDVAPMAEHVEDDAAAIFLAVVPGWSLGRLQIAFEDPIAELDPGRKDAAEESGLAQHFQFQGPRQIELVLHHAVLHPGSLGPAVEIEGLFRQVGKGEADPTRLKLELDRWGLFPDYEDRFLGLFRKG